MAITILTPKAAAPATNEVRDQNLESDEDEDGDVRMLVAEASGSHDQRSAQLADKGGSIVTPGELVTDETTWMR